MEDREEGGFLFFLYQPCNPSWILEFHELDTTEEKED